MVKTIIHVILFHNIYYNYIDNDRKTNIELWEASKKANLDEVKRLRDENKEYRSKIAICQRVNTH